jgi:hypothetical protein
MRRDPVWSECELPANSASVGLPVQDKEGGSNMALNPFQQRTLIRERVESDLAFLWDDTKVDLTNQVALATAGYTSVRIFVGLADTKAELRTVLAADFQLDPAAVGALPATRLQVACLLAAWDAASQMCTRDSQLRTEAKTLGITKPVSVPERTAMRRVYEATFGRLPVAEQPSSTYLSMKQEEVETDDPVASPLDEVSSPEDTSLEAVSSSLDTSGRVMVTKKRAKGTLPTGPEQFRMRLRIEANCWIYLSGKFTSKQWLQDQTPQLWQRYTDYFLGARCNGMEISDALGNKVPLRPPWTVVLAYEYACRKWSFERVREDFVQLSVALMDSIKNSELKECNFTSPIALMSKGGNKTTFSDDIGFDPPPGKFARLGRGRGRDGRGRGRGRGREGRGRATSAEGKAAGKGSLVSKTPDGREICFKYSSPEGCSDANCARVHCCRVRGCNAPHPTAAHAGA